MIYSDEENLRWWKGLPKIEKREILDTIEEKAKSPWFQGLVNDVRLLVVGCYEPSPKQLTALRKWAR